MIHLGNLIIVLFILGLIIGLQVFLSTRKNKWLGLILPVICVVYSIIAVFSVVAFNNHITTTVTSYTEDGTVIEESVQENSIESSRTIGEIVASSAMVFVVSNIPTVIYLAIYFRSREKMKKKQQLEHMQIQDLE